MSHALGNRLQLDAPRSRHYQGPFGRLFAHLEPWQPGAAELQAFNGLEAFAKNEMVEEQGANSTKIAKTATLRAKLDQQFNSEIPAGYTYFGQFVDHDITFDPTPLGARVQDPDGLHNFRTPRLDLDNVYGRGPDDQPYLYDDTSPANAKRFLLGQVADSDFEGSKLTDLPRNTDGRALIGDMRNDENAIVSQLQLAFLRAHNTLVAHFEQDGHPHPLAEARRLLTWLYQWSVWNDFLKRILDPDIWDAALSFSDEAGSVPTLGLPHIYDWKHQPFMPLEFTAAAYRFGHSMVRNDYQTNEFGTFHPIFDNTKKGKKAADLRGDRPMIQERSLQWDWFFQMESSRADFGFPQRARKIDTKLSNALASLPFFGPSASPDNVLAFRNLKRGIDLGLPSGPDVARALSLGPIALQDDEPKALWYYILKEAEAATSGERLGQLGSSLVAAVFAGLLKGDKRSFVNIDPQWHPSDETALKAVKDVKEDWGLPTIIRLSGLPVSAKDFQALRGKPKPKPGPAEGSGTVGAGD